MMAAIVQAKGTSTALDDFATASESRKLSMANTRRADNLYERCWKGTTLSLVLEFCQLSCLWSYVLSWTLFFLFHWNTQMVLYALVQASIGDAYGAMDLDWESKILATRGPSPYTSTSSSKHRSKNIVTHMSVATAISQGPPEACGDDLPSDDETSVKRRRMDTTSEALSVVKVQLACPFRKHDPGKYNLPGYFNCASSPYQSISHVK